MRPIDADALLPNGVFYVDVDNPMKGLDELLDRIINAPTIDLAPVKHGEWMTKPDGFIPADIYCSECGKRYNFFVAPNYCPNCGLKMDGGANHA